MVTETEKAHALLQTFSSASVISSVALAVFCFLSDSFLQFTFVHQNDWIRALTDNAVHGIVGLWSWALVIGLRKKSDFCEVLLAGFLASAIDLDHFVLAGSLSLKAALHLPKRPFLHCSTIIPLVALILKCCLQIFKLKDSWCFLPWMVFISWTSHHIRDGTRQGLWFCPFGSIAPLPYWLYIAMTASLPHLCS
uniref:Transmembrane protein 267 n=2 Tax=Latimeria chalumnae TaxID=7897 RepID=H2ZXX8_LATCH